MRQRDLAQRYCFAFGEWFVVAGHTEADLRKADGWSVRNGQCEIFFHRRNIFTVTRKRFGNITNQFQGHQLLNGSVALNFYWKEERQGRAIGFKTGVGLIALILHFESFTLKIEARPKFRCHFMRQAG